MVSLAAHRLTAPLANRDFRILWLGQGISALGDPLQAIALAWLVLERTGSSSSLATTMIALTVPRALVALAGGVATDWLASRTIMFWCDVVRAGTIGLLAGLAELGRLDTWMLYALLAVAGSAGGIFVPAATSVTPSYVQGPLLQPANALMQMTPQLAMVTGAPLAGALVAVTSPAAALGVNALSFAVAAASVRFLRDLSPSQRASDRAPLWREATAGLIAVWRLPWLRVLLGVDAILTLAVSGPLSVGLPVLIREGWTAGAETYSLLLAAFGAGSFLGMGFLGASTPVRRPGLVFCLLQLAQAPLVALVVRDVPLLAAVALLGIGLLHGLSGVIYLTLIHDRVPATVRGRIMSVVALVAFCLVPLSQGLTGLLGDFLGVANVFLLTAVVMTIGAIAGLLAPALRRVT